MRIILLKEYEIWPIKVDDINNSDNNNDQAYLKYFRRTSISL